MNILKITVNNKNYNKVLSQLKKLNIKADYINSGLGFNEKTKRINKTTKFIIKDQQAINKLISLNIYDIKSVENWTSESNKKYNNLYYVKFF